MVAVVRLPGQGLGVPGIEPDLERTRSPGHTFVVGDPASGTDDLDVAAAQRSPCRTGGVEVGVLTVEDEGEDLEAFVAMEAELEVVGEAAVGPVEQPSRRESVGAVATDHRLVGPDHTARAVHLELVAAPERSQGRGICCHIYHYTTFS